MTLNCFSIRIRIYHNLPHLNMKKDCLRQGDTLLLFTLLFRSTVGQVFLFENADMNRQLSLKRRSQHCFHEFNRYTFFLKYRPSKLSLLYTRQLARQYSGQWRYMNLRIQTNFQERLNQLLLLDRTINCGKEVRRAGLDLQMMRLQDR